MNENEVEILLRAKDEASAVLREIEVVCLHKAREAIGDPTFEFKRKSVVERAQVRCFDCEVDFELVREHHYR